MEANEIIRTATNFQHLLRPNEQKSLNEFSKIISTNYCLSNLKTKTLCELLDKVEGTITINRYGACWLKFKKL